MAELAEVAYGFGLARGLMRSLNCSAILSTDSVKLLRAKVLATVELGPVSQKDISPRD
jgi:hypothetical protein